MFLVFISVSTEFIERINKEFPGLETAVLSAETDVLPLIPQWTAASEVLVIYGNTGNYAKILESVRLYHLHGQFIAALTRKSIVELQELINYRQLDFLFRMPGQANNLLEKLTELIRAEKVSMTETLLAADPLEESMVTSFFIYDLIYGDIDKANRMKTLRDKYGLLGFPNCAMTIMVDNFWEICRDLDNKSRYEIKTEYLSILKDYLKTASMECISCSLIGTDKLIALVSLPGEALKGSAETVYKMAVDLKKYINRRAKNTVSIGIGNVYSDPNLIWKSYEEAFKALEYSFYVGSDSVIQFEETRNFTTLENDHDKLPNFKYNFFKNIGNWSESETVAYYETTLQHLVSKSFSSETIKSIVIKYNFEILDYLEQLDLADSTLNEYGFKLASGILRSSTMETITKLNHEFISRVAATIVKNRTGDPVIAAVDSAKAFIDKYYYRDLSLEVMSQVTNLSAAYFSRKFKDRTGLNYSDYLEGTRLAKAAELLLTSEMSLNDIAEKVGFNDYSYFSTRFKKKYGIGPSFYKQYTQRANQNGQI